MIKRSKNKNPDKMGQTDTVCYQMSQAYPKLSWHKITGLLLEGNLEVILSNCTAPLEDPKRTKLLTQN